MYSLYTFSNASQNRFFFFSLFKPWLTALTLVLVLSFILISMTNLYSAQVKLVWDANNEPYLGGYKLYYGLKSDDYTTILDVGNQTNYTLDLKGGYIYYFAITAYDVSGKFESDFSNEVIVNISMETVYEDADNIFSGRWIVFNNNNTTGSSISNVYDDYRQSNVIEFSGYAQSNIFQLVNDKGKEWDNSSQFLLKWSIRYSEPFVIYIDVKTTSGNQYLYYTPEDVDYLGRGMFVHHGLGKWAADGNWHTFIRDLQADLKEAQPDTSILEVDGFLIRGNGRIDDIKLLYPHTADSDKDLISDAAEINIYGTDPNKADTDEDGISDTDELAYWEDRWETDFDGDGLNNLSDPDSDNDGFIDGVEIEQGLNPSEITLIKLTVYEDAEDLTTDRWIVYNYNNSGRLLINNIYDDVRKSNVIEFTSDTQSNIYYLTTPEGTKWHNSSQFIIELSIRYAKTFVIYLEIETTAGFQYLYYTPADNDFLGIGMFVHHGLGSWIIDNNWHTIVRDLQADLREAQPDVTILKVNGLLIRGNGRVDDILLRSNLPK